MAGMKDMAQDLELFNAPAAFVTCYFVWDLLITLINKITKEMCLMFC